MPTCTSPPHASRKPWSATDAPAPNLELQSRADLVTASDAMRRAEAGADIDAGTVAAMFDRVLAASCPHDPPTHHAAPDVVTGRPVTSCEACRVTRHADYPERLEHITSYREGHPMLEICYGC